MSAKRLAWSRISRVLVQDVLPNNGQCISCYFTLRENRDKLRNSLLLPSNCRVISVSEHYLFAQNELSLVLECPDFILTPEGSTLPGVTAWFRSVEVTPSRTEGDKYYMGESVLYFERWEPDSVLVPEKRGLVYGPDGKVHGMMATWQPEGGGDGKQYIAVPTTPNAPPVEKLDESWRDKPSML